MLAGAAALESYAERDKEISWFLADCLALVGESDRALRWLDHTVELGFVNERLLATRDPFLAPLRGDARFDSVMDKARRKQRALRATLG